MVGKRWTIDFIKNELIRLKGNKVTIVENSFNGSRKIATFIDKDFGEFVAIPRNVISRNTDHPERGKLKKKLTNLKKFGSETYMQSDDFKNKSKVTLLKKYGVEHISKHPETIKKITKSNKNNSERLINGLTQAEFSRKYNIHQSLVSRLIVHNKLTDKQMINYIENPPSTLIERIISEDNNLPLYNKFHNTLNYKPDFYINGLAIETDGLYYHSDAIENDKYYHFNKRKDYENIGERVIQFREDEINYKRPIVNSMIQNYLGKVERKIYARKTKIKSVSHKEASDFLISNHLMGKTNGVTHIGLYLNDELVSLISYKKRSDVAKIERFASKINSVVIGALSKLLKNIERNVDINEIHSWVDLRYGNGNSLNILGFTPIKETLGFKWTNKNITFNRTYCRANMDDRGLSQKEHAKEMKLYKIYDAGQRLYVKKIKKGVE